MNNEKVFELYEKLYFHEVEAREKISARLQIPLAIILSITSVYAYLLKGISINNAGGWNIAFCILLLVSFAIHCFSMVYFIRVFYGHTYEFIPSASETENYRNTLIETYSDYAEKDELVSKHFNEYLFRYYNECSSANTIINDSRSEFLHKCNTFSIANVIPLSILFLIFTFSGIDKNSIVKEYRIKLASPVIIENLNKPIEINGTLNTNILEIDFSNEIKEVLRAQRNKNTATATATAAAPKEIHK